MSKRYVIDNVLDILEIPEDRLDHFLIDLKSWYVEARDLNELMTIASEIVGEDAMIATQKFTWIDDGKHDMSVTITVNSKKERGNE